MKRYCILAGLPIAVSLSISWVAQAQIVPTNDATGTIVTPDGDRLRIEGGQTSKDGTNLFHSFDRFNLSERQIADFVANPQLRNILGRIIGGDVSVINGLIQITGGNPNLYLLNPAGIIFGPTARLNVPADFTATTANAIGFGQRAWFSAVGLPDYTNLVGTPHLFAFATPQPSAILNAGELAVPPGQNLTLLGGSVMSTGRLSTPGGEVTIAAVPGERLVRLSQSGQLLSLEVSAIDPATAATPPASALPAAFQLPELLTGGRQGNATSLTVGTDGVMRLAGAGVHVPPQPGAAIVVGTIDVASKGVGGSVNVIGDRVALTGANINAAGAQGGGTVRIGGELQGRGAIPNAYYSYVDDNSEIQADALHQGPGGQVIVWSDETTQVNGQLSARGGLNGGDGGLIETSGKVGLDVAGARVDARAPQGKPGTWLLDPINITISANPASLNNINNQQIADTLTTGTNVSINTANDDFQEAGNITVLDPIRVSNLSGTPTLSLEADNNIVVSAEITNDDFPYGKFNLNLNASNLIDINAEISTGGGDFSANSASFSSNVAIATSGGSIDIQTTGTNGITSNSLSSTPLDYFSAGGPVSLTAQQGNIVVNSFIDAGSDLTIQAPAGSVEVSSASIPFGSGNIDINAGSNITVGSLSTYFGDISLQANNQITLESGSILSEGNFTSTSDSIRSFASTLDAFGGNITITATGPGGIDLNTHLDSTGIDAGAISLNAPRGNIVVRSIRAVGAEGSGGNVSLYTEVGTVRVTGTIPEGFCGDASICTLGFTPGTVAITHGGGPENWAFGVGDPTVNGTANSIVALSDEPLEPTQYFDMLPSGGSVNPVANVTITSVNSPPSLNSANTSFSGAQPGQPFAISFANLNPQISDPDGDNVTGASATIVITSIAEGATLTLNGSPVIPGETFIQAGDVLIYTPPSDATGTFPAFEIAAADPRNGSPFLATSTPQPVIVTIGTTPPPPPPPPPPVEPPPPPVEPPPPPVEPPPPPVEPPPPPVEPPPPPVEPPPPPVEPPPPPVEPPPPPVEPPPPPVEPPPPLVPPEPSPIVLTPAAQVAIATALQVVPRPTPPIAATVPPATLDPIVNTLETEFTQAFEQHLGQPATPTPTATLDQIHDALRQVEVATGIKPALIYLSFVPSQLGAERPTTASPDDQLELVMVTSSGTPPIRRRLANAPRRWVVEVADELRAAVASPDQTFTHVYREPAQQLYQWIIAPLLPDLTAQGIGNLVFIPDVRLRSLPYAALMTGDRFLIEDYSVGLMPSISLTDTRYVDPRQTSILAMGLSEAVQGQAPLPAVPAEIDKLLSLWSGRSYLNEQFTVEQLRQTRSQTPYGIVHLATHADITPGSIDRSYIQFWDRRVPLSRDQIRQLQLNSPPVELLGLSACRTALGDEKAELGFAGLAVQSGVKSALASLWFISDAATAALMADFYTVLRNAPIKAEALRQAQLAMATGQVVVEGTEVKGLASGQTLTLPAESVQTLSDRVLSHPYYWAGMTLIGNPW